jgi:hypothetical protein
MEKERIEERKKARNKVSRKNGWKGRTLQARKKVKTR